jgi:hypothetical protein
MLIAIEIICLQNEFQESKLIGEILSEIVVKLVLEEWRCAELTLKLKKRSERLQHYGL